MQRGSGMSSTRRIRIFVSSPSDLDDERDQCGSVVQDLNMTLRVLMPEKGVELELIRWETHTHPDLGADPQDVVDDQIPVDYDIFVGMMWTRFGTPTSEAGSGTEHEFRRAHAGRQQRRRPAHILFYFCEAQIPPSLARNTTEQLKAIHDFHTELSGKCLLGSYETHAAFGDTLRCDLVRVLGRLLHAGQSPAQVAQRATEGMLDTDTAIVRERVKRSADEYEQLRDTRDSGPDRTRRMEVVASTLRTLAQSIFGLLPELMGSDSPGERLAAVCTLQAIPDPRYLGWLGERFCTEKPFLAYHAAQGLLVAARELPDAKLGLVHAALRQAKSFATTLGPDTD
ncbi:MAG TPA: DUF4062 domain-containing protein, partial [Pseudonocardiaceae bacterium]